jgi:hypothetical protein
MNWYPAVTVHGLQQARGVLALGRPVTLLSAYGAALYAGCLWWVELIAAARAAVPDTQCEDILDCADAPGRAMAALRVGQRLLILDPALPAYQAVAAAAATLGATVLPARPPSLDLGPRDLRDAYKRARLAQWLAQEPPGQVSKRL